MCTNRIITALTALSVTLAIHAQEVTSERFPGRQVTETQHSEQRIALPVDPQAPDTLIEVWTLDINTYVDTVRTVSTNETTVTQPGDSTRRGHYVEIHAGAGVGNVGYGWLRRDLQHTTAKGYEQFGISGVAQLQYAYFFHPSVGVGVGAWLANYTSHGYLSGDVIYRGLKQENGKYVPDFSSTVRDNDGKGEYYNHHVTIHSWHERQTIHTAGVPVSLQFQAWGKKNKAGFFASLGAAPTFTVKTDYRILDGDIEHWGEYAHRGGAELHNLHDFSHVNYSGRVGKQSMKLFTATAFLDLGLLIKMSRHTDFLIGVYGHYDFLDIQAAQRTDLGWPDERFPYLNAPEYKGILATNCLADEGVLRPWQAGVKIGVHWHSVKPDRTSTTIYSDTTIQLYAREDSVWTSRVDTLKYQKPTIEQIQREIDKLNRIYFAFDSYELNEESMALLRQIAEQLKTIPNKVLIGGHASKEGLRAHNARLARYRALIVTYFLVDCGIPNSRLIHKDYGSDVENAINIHHDLSLDRRVEIIVQEE